MAISSINNYTQPVSTASSSTTKKDSTENTKSASSSTSASESSGVVYEKSSSTAKTSTPNYKADGASIVAKMKADSNNRLQQLQSLVSQMMTKQGTKIGTADSIWSFLAGGNFTVTEAAKAQAQKDIADDGYWGVNQTSDRIVEFAKALSAGNPEKADEMLEAFKKGFGQATKSWGKDLPDVSSRTYDAVIEKFDAWKNEGKTTETEE